MKLNLQRILIVGSVLPLALGHATSVHANSTFSVEKIDLRGGSNGFGFDSVGQAINTIISIIFFLAALAAFFYILLGAFNYVTAGDDAGKTEKARKTITNAVVGLILVALVYVIWLIAIRIVPGLSQFFVGGSAGGT